MRVYKDGVDVGRTAKSGSISTKSSVRVAIGNAPANVSGSRGLDGLVDEVYVFERALSQQEIQDLVD